MIAGTDRELDGLAVRSRELVVYCDGLDEGLPGFAARSRDVARETLELIAMLRAERSARIAIQAQRDAALEPGPRRSLETVHAR